MNPLLQKSEPPGRGFYQNMRPNTNIKEDAQTGILFNISPSFFCDQWRGFVGFPPRHDDKMVGKRRKCHAMSKTQYIHGNRAGDLPAAQGDPAQPGPAPAVFSAGGAGGTGAVHSAARDLAAAVGAPGGKRL